MASAVIAAFVVAGLAVLALLPALSPRLARSEAWARLKVHLRQGLYLSTWLDRRLRQPRTNPSKTIRGVHS
jgi:hypothetical protein